MIYIFMVVKKGRMRKKEEKRGRGKEGRRRKGEKRGKEEERWKRRGDGR